MTGPLLDDFAGCWRIAREIEDRLSGEIGRFEGKAVFTRAAGGLDCVETGVLTLPGRAPMRAERRYLYAPDPAGGLAVRFADGRPFHRIAPGTATPEDAHDCPPDLYRVRYDFRDWPDWQSVWQVSGPRKDYTLRSAYLPAAPRPF